MKTIITTIVLSTLAALSFADENQFPVPAGTLTRAEVQASINDRSNATHFGDATVFAEPTTSTLTRAQVLAEAAADRASRHGYGESSAVRFAHAADQEKATARADVMGNTNMAHLGRKFGDANRDDFNQYSH